MCCDVVPSLNCGHACIVIHKRQHLPTCFTQEVPRYHAVWKVFQLGSEFEELIVALRFELHLEGVIYVLSKSLRIKTRGK
jgi:hypothetical protein